MQRFFLPGLIVVLSVLSVALVADALVITDEEKLEAFVDDLTDDSPDKRVDGALHYADTSRVDVEVTSPDDRAYYGDGDDLELADHLRDALASLDHGSVSLLQRTVRVRGDDGLAALRLDTEDGVLDAEFRFVRRADGWLLRRVRVR
jgi:hypothetical protein